MYETTIHEYEDIRGLRWVRNVNVTTGPKSSILLGGKVTTAVIREEAPTDKTEYSVYGIHLATDDELTFITKADDKPIVVRMIDCRRGSPTLHNHLDVVCDADPGKRLVIPRGVAHLPMNLNGLITLNTPTLYWDPSRRHVNLELDVINVERDRPFDRFPVYDVCRYRLPDWLYPIAIRTFKKRFDPDYEAPFVFDRGGKLYVLRRKVEDMKKEVESEPQELVGAAS